MPSIFTIIVIPMIIILLLVIFWFISTQNQLVNRDELCSNALSQIGIQQNSRWDALTALVQLTKSYAEHEYKTFERTIAMRKNLGEKSLVSEFEQQEQLLNESYVHINAVAEAYPELKSNTTYIKTMDSVNKYEENVRMSRMVYNDSVTIYNRLTRQFPSGIVASMLRFDSREYLNTEQGKMGMPEMRI